MPAFAVVAHAASPTNTRLGQVPSPTQALMRLGAGDVALGRIDVLPRLDGIESGLWALDLLRRRGVTVLNDRQSLVRSHDKLATARALLRAGVSHPAIRQVAPWRPLPELDYPVVFKPRFGSWGRDVVACASRAELVRAVEQARGRVWFNATGGIAQELVPPAGYDLRVVVAGRKVVGAVHRVAPAGEWRTNVALGARRLPASPPRSACALALAAAAAVGGDLVGVDLLPLGAGGFTVVRGQRRRRLHPRLRPRARRVRCRARRARRRRCGGRSGGAVELRDGLAAGPGGCGGGPSRPPRHNA